MKARTIIRNTLKVMGVTPKLANTNHNGDVRCHLKIAEFPSFAPPEFWEQYTHVTDWLKGAEFEALKQQFNQENGYPLVY